MTSVRANPFSNFYARRVEAERQLDHLRRDFDNLCKARLDDAERVAEMQGKCARLQKLVEEVAAMDDVDIDRAVLDRCRAAVRTWR
jgi:hypothetical protein